MSKAPPRSAGELQPERPLYAARPLTLAARSAPKRFGYASLALAPMLRRVRRLSLLFVDFRAITGRWSDGATPQVHLVKRASTFAMAALATSNVHRFDHGDVRVPPPTVHARTVNLRDLVDMAHGKPSRMPSAPLGPRTRTARAVEQPTACSCELLTSTSL